MPNYMTRQQTADLLSVHVNTVDRLRRRDDFPPPHMFGERTPRWSEADVEKWARGKQASRR